MKIETININKINPYENNPRQISDQSINVVAKSIKEFGFVVPVILDKDNTIISGHARLKAAKKLKLKQVPFIRVTDLTPAQVRAFRIMDNKSHEYSEWNLDLIKEEMAMLKKLDYDLDLTGFDSPTRKVMNIEKDLGELPDVTLLGEIFEQNDAIIIQLESKKQANKIRTLLNLKKHQKSIKSSNFLKALKNARKI